MFVANISVVATVNFVKVVITIGRSVVRNHFFG